MVAVARWFFPLFHVVPLKGSGGTVAGGRGVAEFDAVTAAARIWNGELRTAATRAVELKQIASLLRMDLALARKQHAKASGLGTAYFLVRGSGKVINRDRSTVRIAVDGAEQTIVSLRIGPVFGNTVRDGCGVLDVNAFPGLQAFNALAAELNALVEKNVLPVLRDRAAVGATVSFVGGAEVPESVGGSDEPLLTIVPVEAEVRG